MNPDIPATHKDTIDVVKLFQRAWGLFTQKAIEHVLASLIVIVLGSISLGVLLGPLAVGQIRMVDKQQRGETIIVQDVFSGFSSFGTALLVSLVFFAGVTVASAIFVLPGLFLIAAWGNAWFFVALQGASVSDSLGASWNLLKTQTASVLVVLVLIAVANTVAGASVLAVLLTAPLSAIFGTLAFQEMTSGSAPLGPPV